MSRKNRTQKNTTKPIIMFCLTLIIFLVFSGVGVLFAYTRLQRPVSHLPVQAMAFTIEKGQSVSTIADNLHQANLIRHPLVFKVVVRQNNLATNLQAGDFQLSPSMTTLQIAQALTNSRSEEIVIRLLEGWRREEMADYLNTQVNSNGGSFNRELFLQLTQGKEGYLFPNTYRIGLKATEQDIVELLTTEFTTQTQDLDLNGKTLEEVIILASIIERETRIDRSIVAGVLQNRLDIGMALQVDASLQYIKGFDARTQDWWPTPLAADKELDSPYNTYMYPGLPPAPIANPARSAIEAAANPASTDYLYYITGNDGQMYYGETYDDHLVNINQHLR